MDVVFERRRSSGLWPVDGGRVEPRPERIPLRVDAEWRMIRGASWSPGCV
jgi:hypothetical protein